MNCPNCNAALSCGCQKRVASNGKQCCTNCIARCNNAAGVGNPVLRPGTAIPGPYTPHPG
jgi:hypothetical protein